MAHDEIADVLAGMALFADLSKPRLEAVAHTFEEQWFAEGERIIRQGFRGTGFYVIVDGQAAVRIDGVDRVTLARGDFFGEVSILLGESPIADIVALRPLRCVVLAGPDLEGFLVEHPRVMYRMLQAMARRLRNTSRWER